MKWIKKFTLFEEEPQTFTFNDLSQEAKKNAIKNVREEMWEGGYGADDISSWVIDDDYIFEPTHDEMVAVFGPNYNDSLDGNPMIANDRDDISYVAKDDQNYFLHCKKALNVTNDGMFLGFLGIPPYFWDEISYYFEDYSTYTRIQFEIENEDEMDQFQLSRLIEYLDKASEKFRQHMDSVLTRITRDIEDQYEDEQIKDRIESNDIIFDSEGNTL